MIIGTVLRALCGTYQNTLETKIGDKTRWSLKKTFSFKAFLAPLPSMKQWKFTWAKSIKRLQSLARLRCLTYFYRFISLWGKTFRIGYYWQTGSRNYRAKTINPGHPYMHCWVVRRRIKAKSHFGSNQAKYGRKCQGEGCPQFGIYLFPGYATIAT